MIRNAYARFDTVALGSAAGLVVGVLVFLLTAIPLARGVVVEGMILSSLAAYLPGYEVSWSGAVFGALAGSVGGFLFGSVLAAGINSFVKWHGLSLLRRLEHARSLDPE